jgi:hypothetical protein
MKFIKRENYDRKKENETKKAYHNPNPDWDGWVLNILVLQLKLNQIVLAFLSNHKIYFTMKIFWIFYFNRSCWVRDFFSQIHNLKIIDVICNLTVVVKCTWRQVQTQEYNLNIWCLIQEKKELIVQMLLCLVVLTKQTPHAVLTSYCWCHF